MENLKHHGQQLTNNTAVLKYGAVGAGAINTALSVLSAYKAGKILKSLGPTDHYVGEFKATRNLSGAAAAFGFLNLILDGSSIALDSIKAKSLHRDSTMENNMDKKKKCILAQLLRNDKTKSNIKDKGKLVDEKSKGKSVDEKSKDKIKKATNDSKLKKNKKNIEKTLVSKKNNKSSNITITSNSNDFKLLSLQLDLFDDYILNKTRDNSVYRKFNVPKISDFYNVHFFNNDTEKHYDFLIFSRIEWIFDLKKNDRENGGNDSGFNNEIDDEEDEDGENNLSHSNISMDENIDEFENSNINLVNDNLTMDKHSNGNVVLINSENSMNGENDEEYIEKIIDVNVIEHENIERAIDDNSTNIIEHEIIENITENIINETFNYNNNGDGNDDDNEEDNNVEDNNGKREKEIYNNFTNISIPIIEIYNNEKLLNNLSEIENDIKLLNLFNQTFPWIWNRPINLVLHLEKRSLRIEFISICLHIIYCLTEIPILNHWFEIIDSLNENIDVTKLTLLDKLEHTCGIQRLHTKLGPLNMPFYKNEPLIQTFSNLNILSNDDRANLILSCNNLTSLLCHGLIFATDRLKEQVILLMIHMLKNKPHGHLYIEKFPHMIENLKNNILKRMAKCNDINKIIRFWNVIIKIESVASCVISVAPSI
ncbi:hypothetical protein PV326_001623 [Microctonus aethiopoides]|nr:hypothetical protein PV326_001623 [Microctonus aethiopoides]